MFVVLVLACAGHFREAGGVVDDFWAVRGALSGSVVVVVVVVECYYYLKNNYC